MTRRKRKTRAAEQLFEDLKIVPVERDPDFLRRLLSASPLGTPDGPQYRLVLSNGTATAEVSTDAKLERSS